MIHGIPNRPLCSYQKEVIAVYDFGWHQVAVILFRCIRRILGSWESLWRVLCRDTGRSDGFCVEQCTDMYRYVQYVRMSVTKLSLLQCLWIYVVWFSCLTNLDHFAPLCPFRLCQLCGRGDGDEKSLKSKVLSKVQMRSVFPCDWAWQAWHCVFGVEMCWIRNLWCLYIV